MEKKRGRWETAEKVETTREKSEMKVVTERKDGKRENKKDRCKAERKAERN